MALDPYAYAADSSVGNAHVPAPAVCRIVTTQAVLSNLRGSEGSATCYEIKEQRPASSRCSEFVFFVFEHFFYSSAMYIL